MKTPLAREIDDAFQLAAASLLAGFIFVTFWNRTKIRSVRYEGYRLLLYSSIWGVIFTLIAIFILRIPLLGSMIDKAIMSFFAPYSFQFSDFSLAFLSFVIGSVIWIPLNYYLFKEKLEYQQAILKFGNQLENFLFLALIKQLQVSVTLKNRKVYIGYVYEDIDPKKERGYFTLFPILSGYRDQNKLTLEIVTDYKKVYEDLAEDPTTSLGRENILNAYDLRICIRADKIVSVNIYDPDINAVFQKQSEEKKQKSDT